MSSLTLHPSVASWTLPCRSNYVIRRGRVIEAPPWTDAEIAAERRRDPRAKASYFGQGVPDPALTSLPEPAVEVAATPEPALGTWLRRLRGWWREERR